MIAPTMDPTIGPGIKYSNYRIGHRMPYYHFLDFVLFLLPIYLIRERVHISLQFPASGAIKPKSSSFVPSVQCHMSHVNHSINMKF